MMRWQWKTAFGSAAVCALLLTCARADEAGTASSDVGAIRSAAKQYLAALQRNDIAALRSMWTADGDYVDAGGNRVKAQELFTGPAKQLPADVTVDVPPLNSSIRIIVPGVAIEDGTLPNIKQADGRVVNGRYTAVWVKLGERWLIDSLREATSEKSATKAPLRDLEWMIGEWAGSAGGNDFLISAHVTDDGNYLIRKFLVGGPERETLTATERIAWNPATKQLRSWTFDSHGSTGQGIWRREGGQWVVETKVTMHDGQQATSRCVYKPGDDGTFVWEAVRANVGSTDLPQQSVEFSRARDN